MKRLVIRQVKSSIGRPERQRKVLRGLGLRKIGDTVIRQDTPEIRGMINKIYFLLRIEEVQEDAK